MVIIIVVEAFKEVEVEVVAMIMLLMMTHCRGGV